jgi:hypothetical protein
MKATNFVDWPVWLQILCGVRGVGVPLSFSFCREDKACEARVPRLYSRCDPVLFPFPEMTKEDNMSPFLCIDVAARQAALFQILLVVVFGRKKRHGRNDQGGNWLRVAMRLLE